MKSTRGIYEEKNQKIIQEIDEILKQYQVSFELICAVANKSPRFPVYINEEMMQADILDLDLSVRSSNCLKRAKYSTVGQLVENVNRPEDLLSIHSMGKNSANEVMLRLFLYQFSKLDPIKKKKYVRRFLELNLL